MEYITSDGTSTTDWVTIENGQFDVRAEEEKPKKSAAASTSLNLSSELMDKTDNLWKGKFHSERAVNSPSALTSGSGPLAQYFQNTKHTFIPWKDVPTAQQKRLYHILKRFALHANAKGNLSWSDKKIQNNLSQPGGYKVGRWTWKLTPTALECFINGKKHEVPLNSGKVAHTKSLSQKEALSYLTGSHTKRKTRGESVAVRGTVVPQYRIKKKNKQVTLVEESQFCPQDLIWVCWPDVHSKVSASNNDLKNYKKGILSALYLMQSLMQNDETLLLITPRAFIPQRGKVKDQESDIKKHPLYYAYRKAFFETVHQFALKEKTSVVIHAVQKNELPIIAKLGSHKYWNIAPIDADSDAVGQALAAHGKKVVHTTTGDPTHHMGNGAKSNTGGHAKDERDARLFMASYLSILSGKINPCLKNIERYTCSDA